MLQENNYAIIACQYKTTLTKIAPNASIVYTNGPVTISRFKDEVSRLLRESQYIQCLLFDISYIEQSENFLEAVYYLKRNCNKDMRMVIVAPYNISKSQVEQLVSYGVYDIATCRMSSDVDPEDEYAVSKEIEYQVTYHVNNPWEFSKAQDFKEAFPEDAVVVNNRGKKKRGGLFGRKNEEENVVQGRPYSLTIASKDDAFIEEVRRICGPDKYFSYVELMNKKAPAGCNAFILDGPMTDSQLSDYEFDEKTDVFINRNHLISKEDYDDANFIDCNARELLDKIKAFYGINGYASQTEEAGPKEEEVKIDKGSGILGNKGAAGKADREAKKAEKERRKQEKALEKQRIKEEKRAQRAMREKTPIPKWPFIVGLIALLFGGGYFLISQKIIQLPIQLPEFIQNIGSGTSGQTGKETASPTAETPKLNLSKKEITIEYNDKYNYEEYVDKLPDGFHYVERDDIKNGIPGTYAAVIELWDETHKIEESTMIVNVVDRTVPVITFTEEEVHFETMPEAFVCKDYVATAQDEVDGDIAAKVHCSDAIKHLKEQTVLYEVIDNSGNKGTAELKVIIDDGEEVVTETPAAETAEPTATPSQEQPSDSGMKFTIDEMVLKVGASQADIEQTVRTSIHRVEGTGESSISINYSEVDTTKAGTYSVYYTITSGEGNTEVMTGTLRVE